MTPYTSFVLALPAVRHGGGGLKFNLSLSLLLPNLLAFTYLHILTLTLFSQNTKNQKRKLTHKLGVCVS